VGAGWDRFKREIGQELKHKFQQGCDELANALFTGRAYMPWPGPRQQTLHQQAEHAIDLQEEIDRIRESRVQSPEPNTVSYTEQLNEVANRGGNEPENDRGR
jgi:hypothetical protein